MVKNMKKYGFPEDFIWGTATAAAQVEGAAFEDGRGLSIWDAFCHLPNVRLDTPDVACDQYHRYEEDIALMKDLGIQAYRFSFSWSRILPEGTGKINQAGLDYYRRMIDCLKRNGIMPCATIYHWDLPYALQLKGGFGSREIVKWYLEYVNILLQNFGSDIDMWITFNEPISIYAGYGLGFFAPGMKDEKYARQCIHNLLLCHGEAVKLFRSFRLPNARIGITVDVWRHYPNRPDNPADIAMARHENETQGYGMFLHPLFLGGYSEYLMSYMEKWGFTPDIQPGDFETIRQPLDFYGLNYYNGIFDQADDPHRLDMQPGGNFQTSVREGYYYEALPDVLRMLKEKYKISVPIYITENGFCQTDETPDENGAVHDPKRIEYLENILIRLHQAIENGADVRGYFLWSLLDNFEWTAGYSMRYGITRVDFNTQLRTVKDSGCWYRKVIENNGFSID